MMVVAELRKMAKTLGVERPEKLKKLDLVRAIQSREGNFPCFGTANGYCDQTACAFREDCLGRATQ